MKLAAAVALATLALAACQSDHHPGVQIDAGHVDACPLPSCPATWVDIVLTVTSSQGSGAIAGVQVTYSGAATGTMNCASETDATTCRWPSGPFVLGNYVLVVSAPGYQTATVPTDAIIIGSDSPCACSGATLMPSAVMLTPS